MTVFAINTFSSRLCPPFTRLNLYHVGPLVHLGSTVCDLRSDLEVTCSLKLVRDSCHFFMVMVSLFLYFWSRWYSAAKQRSVYQLVIIIPDLGWVSQKPPDMTTQLTDFMYCLWFNFLTQPIHFSASYKLLIYCGRSLSVCNVCHFNMLIIWEQQSGFQI